MKLKITGRNLDVGDALRAHIVERLEQVTTKFFTGSVSGHVTLLKEGSDFKVDCLVHVDTGIDLQTEARGSDPYGCVDAAITKLEKRMRRYKRRLRDHHTNRKTPVRRFDVPDYLIHPASETEAEAAELNPVIIAENRVSLQELSVGEAVMQMDISESSFLLFRNGAHGRLNVVYRRPDGNIGWIDPEFENT
ncbi:MAG: ribosome hibernation-promoting factor, HPF/YfiA family [Alphaproteobacteria bacterium]